MPSVIPTLISVSGLDKAHNKKASPSLQGPPHAHRCCLDLTARGAPAPSSMQMPWSSHGCSHQKPLRLVVGASPQAAAKCRAEPGSLQASSGTQGCMEQRAAVPA